MNLAFFRRQSEVLALPLLPFGVIVALAWCGIVISLGRWRDFLLPHLWLWGGIAGILPFFVIGRLRMPLLPPLLLFAALTAGTIGTALRSRRFATLLAALLLVSLAGVSTFRSRPPLDLSNSFNRKGAILLRLGDREGALAAFSEALRWNPRSFATLKNLVLTCRALGREAEAETFARRLEALRRRERAEMERFLDRSTDPTTGGAP